MSKTVINVNSASDFIVSGGLVQPATYLFQKDVAISANLSFAAGCELIFQGGKLSGSGSPRLLTGNATVIIAPMSCIFDDDMSFAGTWNVREAYPEWFESNADDAVRINRALQLLKSAAGILRLTGTYTINSPIIVPPSINIIGVSPAFTRILLQPKSGVTASNYDIFDVDDDRWNVERKITTIISNVTHTLVKTVRAAIYFQSYENADGLNEGSGARNFKVRMRGCACHGIYIERAYDKSVWENLEVLEVHHSFNAYRFTVPYEYQDGDTQGYDTFKLEGGGTVAQSEYEAWNSNEISRVGQTLLIMNCWGLQNPYQDQPHYLTSPVPPTGKVIAPTYYFYNQQEINLIGCKAGANQANSHRINSSTMRTVDQYGGTCMHFEGCRGVSLSGCSVGGGVVGIAVTAHRRHSEGVTVTGLISEGIVHLDLMAKGDKYEHTNAQGNTVLETLRAVRKLFVTPIRHEDSNGNIYLEECYMSDLNTLVNGQDIYVMPKDYMLNIYSTRSVYYVTPVLNFNPAIQEITGEKGKMVPGSSNVIYSNANLKRGLRFLERVTVTGNTDNNGGSPIVTDSMALQMSSRVGVISLHDVNRMKFSESATLFTSTPQMEMRETEYANPVINIKKTTQSGQTCLTIQAKDSQGNDVYLPVMMDGADPNGKCQLYIQLPTS